MISVSREPAVTQPLLIHTTVPSACFRHPRPGITTRSIKVRHGEGQGDDAPPRRRAPGSNSKLEPRGGAARGAAARRRRRPGPGGARDRARALAARVTVLLSNSKHVSARLPTLHKDFRSCFVCGSACGRDCLFSSATAFIRNSHKPTPPSPASPRATLLRFWVDSPSPGPPGLAPQPLIDPARCAVAGINFLLNNKVTRSVNSTCCFL